MPAFRGKSNMIRVGEIGLFREGPCSRPFAHVFGHPSRRFFFLFVGALLPLGRKVEEVDTRETLRNKGFRSDFASFFLFDPFWCVEKARFCEPFLRIISPACYYLVFFKLHGILSGARANWTRGGRAGALGFLSDLGSPGAEGFRVFFFFFSTPFSQTSGAPLRTPLFLFRCFCLYSHSSWEWGQRRIARVFFGQLVFTPSFLGSWPSRLLFWGGGGGVLFVFLQEHCFSPCKKGEFWFISQCLPFFLLGFFHFSFSRSLSLSIFLVSCFFLPCFCFFSSLFFVLSCLLSFACVSWNFKILHVKGFFHELFLLFILFCFLFQIPFLSLFLFQYSVVCSGEHQCFHLSKTTISKTPFFLAWREKLSFF